MQYPAIWHSVFDQISLTKSLSEHGNELLDAGGFQQVNCSEAPINSKDFFGNKNRRYFELSIEPRTSLTISNISVGQPLNPQSSQGFFAASRAEQLDRSTVRQSEKTKHMSAFHREKVLSVRHWTDTLFSFTATRNSGFRFQNGQFAMIGIEVDGRPL